MTDFTQKAEIFKAVLNCDNYFTIIDELPEKDGVIHSFFVIDIETDKKFSIFKFEKAVIKVFTKKAVKQNSEGRARQLFALMQEYYLDTKKPIILIFHSAHFLQLKFFRAMKTVFENARDFEIALAIIFVGDIPKIDKIINKEKGISLRSDHIQRRTF